MWQQLPQGWVVAMIKFGTCPDAYLDQRDYVARRSPGAYICFTQPRIWIKSEPHQYEPPGR